MTPAATPHAQRATTEATLFVALALSEKTWKRGLTTGHGQTPRERTVPARHQERVLEAIAQATRRLGVPETAPVVRCSEAGREGCWRHRFVQAHGITTQVGDASAREVHRRRRRAKSEGGAVRKLLSRLLRDAQGARQGWQVVTGPAVEAEEHRHRHRDVETLKPERARTTHRSKGVRRSQGSRVTSLRHVPAPLEALRRRDGSPSPPGVRRRGRRVDAHDPLLSAQMAAVEAERRAQRHASTDARLAKRRPLMLLKGIGIKGAWLLVMACFGWRACTNRREVGGLAGCTPTPSQRGERARAPGLTKAGNRHGRGMTTAWAWRGRRLQPARALRVGLRARFGRGGTRVRRMGMVAVARK